MFLSIPAQEVHLYLAPLTVSRDELQTCRELLDANEQARASHFISPAKQESFTVAHGLLRLLLSRYLGMPPKAITFGMGDKHKPHLHSPTHQLKFNLSHSGHFALFAIASGCELGVDIEKIQSDHKMDVAERFFNISEIAALRALPENERAALFFQFWAKKEAIIKANGRGLSQPLSSFAVSAGFKPEMVIADEVSWYLYPLAIHDAYAAALATNQSLSRIIIWDVAGLQPIERTTIPL